jgi:hypothetical protein
MYLIQAMSMTVSVFALKTWPLAMTLLLIYASSDEMVHIGQEDNSIVKKKKMSAQWGF